MMGFVCKVDMEGLSEKALEEYEYQIEIHIKNVTNDLQRFNEKLLINVSNNNKDQESHARINIVDECKAFNVFNMVGSNQVTRDSNDVKPQIKISDDNVFTFLKNIIKKEATKLQEKSSNIRV